jgi:hypothetical protein
MMKLVFMAVVAVAALASGCNRPSTGEDRGRASAGAGEPATPVSREQPAARDLPELLFAGRLEMGELTEAEAPASSPPIGWDFGRERELAYDYGQELTVLLAGDEDQKAAELRATLVVEARGDGTANVALREGQMVADEGETRLEVPAITIEGLRENGSKADAADEFWFIPLLLSLPGRPLAVGETIEVPFAVPFDAFGTVYYGRAPLRLTARRHVEQDGRPCVLIESGVEVAELDAPEGIARSFGLRARGLILYDHEERAIARSKLAIVLQLDGPGHLDDDDDLEMGMIQHHFIELNRR